MTPEEETLVLIKLVIVFITIIKTSEDMLVINSTPKVIRACLFIVLPVLEVIKKVQPTCIIHTDFHVPHDVGDVVPPQQYHCI